MCGADTLVRYVLSLAIARKAPSGLADGSLLKL